jgi:hypothetical protein
MRQPNLNGHELGQNPDLMFQLMARVPNVGMNFLFGGGGLIFVPVFGVAAAEVAGYDGWLHTTPPNSRPPLCETILRQLNNSPSRDCGEFRGH